MKTQCTYPVVHLSRSIGFTGVKRVKLTPVGREHKLETISSTRPCHGPNENEQKENDEGWGEEDVGSFNGLYTLDQDPGGHKDTDKFSQDWPSTLLPKNI